MQLSSQFGTGITPYDLPREASVAPSLPKLNIRLPDDGGDPDPVESKNPTSNPGSKGVSSPKSTGNSNSLWGTIGRDIGIGAGVAGSALAGLSRNPVGEAGDILKQGAGDFTRAASSAETDLAPVINAGKSIGSDLATIGEGAATGAETVAPVAGATDAIGGGPEDPFGDIAAGAEEVGGALGGALKSALTLAA